MINKIIYNPLYIPKAIKNVGPRQTPIDKSVLRAGHRFIFLFVTFIILFSITAIILLEYEPLYAVFLILGVFLVGVIKRILKIIFIIKNKKIKNTVLDCA